MAGGPPCRQGGSGARFAPMRRPYLALSGAILLCAASGSHGCGGSTISGSPDAASEVDSSGSSGGPSETGSQDSGQDAFDAPFCSNGCIEPDGGCHVWGPWPPPTSLIDSAHCGSGANYRCITCGTGQCRYYPGVDGPTCNSSSSSSSSGSGPRDSGSDGADAGTPDADAGPCTPGAGRCTGPYSPEVCSDAGAWMAFPRCYYGCWGAGVCVGPGGAACPSSCASDTDCQTCPITPDAGFYCCDTTHGSCYSLPATVCPAPADAGPG